MDLINSIEKSRINASKEVEYHKQKLFEQYFTPVDIVNYMASLFTNINNVRLLDAGAGVGNLGTISALYLMEKNNNCRIDLTAVEWDKNLITHLKSNLEAVKNNYSEFESKVINDNFYNFAVNKIKNEKKFNRIIINPPYSKTSNSNEFELQLLKDLNIKTPNAYTNFIEICANLLDEDGELVAIVPRSFCNGTRFTTFRNKLLNIVKIEFIHLFESRKKVFKEYGVLQEIIIIKLTKRAIRKIGICISDELVNNEIEKFPISKIIFDNDPYKFIHIPDKKVDDDTLDKIYKLPSSLKELGLNISTGKVVEYREKDLIQDNKTSPAAALVIYQAHLENDKLNLTKAIDKKLFLDYKETSINKMIPSGNYIIMKRISYKESKKRIVTGILFEEDFEYEKMTVENHLNYIHCNNEGIERNLVIGLNAFLNTKTLDNYIRRFNGHTQINASDILSLPMPDYETLVHLGEEIKINKMNEEEIEKLIYKDY